ncbi:MAG: ammonia channel protein, partial [Methylococcaceae bacterium]
MILFDFNKKLFTSCLLLPELAIADQLNQANTAWILTSTALVLFMTIPGLSLFYAGLVRSKNVLSVLMQCFAITCMVSILWLAGVYSFIFANGADLQKLIGGASKVFLPDIGTGALTGDIPETVYFMFQMTFAIITPALIVGAFVERMKFSATLWFSGLWLIIVYMPICHWIWGGGWLADLGVMDFAGGIVIHVNAGVAALVSAMVLG